MLVDALLRRRARPRPGDRRSSPIRSPVRPSRFLGRPRHRKIGGAILATALVAYLVKQLPLDPGPLRTRTQLECLSPGHARVKLLDLGVELGHKHPLGLAVGLQGRFRSLHSGQFTQLEPGLGPRVRFRRVDPRPLRRFDVQHQVHRARCLSRHQLRTDFRRGLLRLPRPSHLGGRLPSQQVLQPLGPPLASQPAQEARRRQQPHTPVDRTRSPRDLHLVLPSFAAGGLASPG